MITADEARVISAQGDPEWVLDRIIRASACNGRRYAEIFGFNDAYIGAAKARGFDAHYDEVMNFVRVSW